MKISRDTRIISVIEHLIGKHAMLKLRSGDWIEGKLQLVGDELVHVSEIVGMEYFDAVVLIDDIAAVQFRAIAG